MPGKWFGMENYIRVGYGTPPDYLKAGLERMAQTLSGLRIEAAA
jgi:aspartate/methionine/tyrosine aminotransferase